MSRITTQTAKKSLKPPRKASPPPEFGGGPAFGSLEHILAVLDRLEDVYRNDDNDPDFLATGEPLDGLILTLLSQNTNDRNRDMAYRALRSAYPEWIEVATLSSPEIAELIRPAGLGETKSARMKDILLKIHADFGTYSLNVLRKWEPAAIREYLSALPGIGPKTVACVMVFDLGIPAFPVDTHVARLSRRFGWMGGKETPEKIQVFLESVVPPERCMAGHLNMIEHGRKVCAARKPRCGDCTLPDLCKYRIVELEAEG